MPTVYLDLTILTQSHMLYQLSHQVPLKLVLL